MPELPEVETVCRGLAPRLVGRRLARVELRRQGLRVPFTPGMAERLSGRSVTALWRRAKYIVMCMEDGAAAIIHLGMSGRMVITESPAGAPGRHDHVILTTDDGAIVTFNDARRFGVMVLCEERDLTTHPLLAGLGPEPLSDDFTPALLSARLARKITPIKAALLDQTVVAGLGNIYVVEALFQAGISPLRSAASVAGAGAELLVPAIRRVLQAAIAAGGSSLRDYVQASGELGYFQHSFAVYGREGLACPGCSCDPAVTGGIERLVQSNRSSWWCPRKQG
ncbi:MAG: bifunctional DNA-formamidopyrimidine glycosylase/DNA-(apurinic or apyrimidinic site) lyase [Rhodospirillaceae bacterium]